METIVPRWEWRTFGEQLGAAGDRFSARSRSSTPKESDELYLLSPVDGDTVKIRDGLMDI